MTIITDSDFPIFQVTDTFTELVQELNVAKSVYDSDLTFLESTIGYPTPRTAGTPFSTLNTTAKSSLVAAINSLKADIDTLGASAVIHLYDRTGTRLNI